MLCSRFRQKLCHANLFSSSAAAWVFVLCMAFTWSSSSIPLVSVMPLLCVQVMSATEKCCVSDCMAKRTARGYCASHQNRRASFQAQSSPSPVDKAHKGSLFSALTRPTAIHTGLAGSSVTSPPGNKILASPRKLRSALDAFEPLSPTPVTSGLVSPRVVSPRVDNEEKEEVIEGRCLLCVCVSFCLFCFVDGPSSFVLLFFIIGSSSSSSYISDIARLLFLFCFSLFVLYFLFLRGPFLSSRYVWCQWRVANVRSCASQEIFQAPSGRSCRWLSLSQA